MNTSASVEDRSHDTKLKCQSHVHVCLAFQTGIYMSLAPTKSTIGTPGDLSRLKS